MIYNNHTFKDFFMNKQYEALEMIKEFLGSVITDKEHLSYKNPEQHASGRLKEINILAEQLLDKVSENNIFSTKSCVNEQLYYLLTEVECTRYENLDVFKTSTDFINALNIINDSSIENSKTVDILLAMVKNESIPNKNKI